MKTILCILFGIVLFGCFSISMVGCLHDDDVTTPTSPTSELGDQYQHMVGLWLLVGGSVMIPGDDFSGIMQLTSYGRVEVKTTVDQYEPASFFGSGDWDPFSNKFELTQINDIELTHTVVPIYYSFDGTTLSFTYGRVIYQWQKR